MSEGIPYQEPINVWALALTDEQLRSYQIVTVTSLFIYYS